MMTWHYPGHRWTLWDVELEKPVLREQKDAHDGIVIVQSRRCEVCGLRQYKVKYLNLVG